MMPVSAHDIEILRTVARQYMEYASLPIQDVKRKMWLSHNSLHAVKPLVLIDQMPWNELNVDGELDCFVENPLFRGIEWTLRTEMYKWKHIPVDMVLNPYILLPRLICDTGYGVSPQVDYLALEHGTTAASQRYHNLFNEPEDVLKITDPVVTVDRAGEKELLETAHYIFDGIAPLRFGGTVLHLGIWDFIAMCMGVENVYVDLMERPEFIHAIMDRFTEAMIARIRQVNELGVYDVNGNLCHCSHTFSADLPGPGCDPDNPTAADGWAFGMAQLFTSVSPQVTEEFEVNYMKRVFPYFGAIYYGCCDRLDDRMDKVAMLPKVRKVSCSPWSDRERFAERLPKRMIMSGKPNPAFLASGSLDEDVVRQDLRRTIRAAKDNGVCLEMILKDISTVRHDPGRLWRWAEIAAEETENA
ncbi:MAG: hypothetical protein MJ192_08525 [Clostridia bacterium]|nr:hypothetical protein [Clostridia bacterium]